MKQKWFNIGSGAVLIALLVVVAIVVHNAGTVYQTMSLAGDVSNFSGVHVAAPTAVGTATPAFQVDTTGVSAIAELRVAATPEYQFNAAALDVNGNYIDQDINTENLMIPSAMSTAIITSTDGALWTIGDGEVWVIHAVFCHITTNFDCDGDDCTLMIGDGTDPKGLLDLVDAELQAADTEGTGAIAGWQGFMSTDTLGAYFTQGLPFIYAPSGSAETIDIDIEDTSGSSDPTAGVATCYMIYTRIE